jgi:hypothetical protein
MEDTKLLKTKRVYRNVYNRYITAKYGLHASYAKEYKYYKRLTKLAYALMMLESGAK